MVFNRAQPNQKQACKNQTLYEFHFHSILRVLPLLKDVFWIPMSVTIMFGLAVGTFLTMILLPVLYCVFCKIKSPQR